MLKVDEFRISNDGKHVIMTVSVRTESYYEDVYIDYLALYTDDTWGRKKNGSVAPVWESQNYGDVKTLSLTIDADDIFAYGRDKIVIKDHLFILQAWADGYPAPGVPCGMDNVITLAITIPKDALYNNFMTYLKEMSNTCEIPDGLIDQILKYKAFDLVAKQGNVEQAINYWNKWYGSGNYVTYTSKTCGCNG